MPGDLPVFLVGFMGSGKSTVAERIAERTGWACADTDALVEEREGRSIDAIFRDRGEGYFREQEFDALRSLDGRRGCVVATGGGLFLGAAQRRWMKRRGRTVWLDVPLRLCVARVGAGEGRPLWVPEDPEAFRALYEKRRAAYALAAVHVRTESGDPDDLAGRILERLGGRRI